MTKDADKRREALSTRAMETSDDLVRQYDGAVAACLCSAVAARIVAIESVVPDLWAGGIAARLDAEFVRMAALVRGLLCGSDRDAWEHSARRAIQLYAMQEAGNLCALAVAIDDGRLSDEQLDQVEHRVSKLRTVLLEGHGL